MAISPFTLQNLYNQGILDYTPMELAQGTNISSLNGMQNPYLNMATQGNLYKNSLNSQDSFCHKNNLPCGIDTIPTDQFGGINGDTLWHSNSGVNALGINLEKPLGNSDAGINGFGGGFGELGKNVSNAVSSTSGLWKGLASGIIALGTIGYCIKKCKKPKQKTTSNFMSKLQFWKKK